MRKSYADDRRHRVINNLPEAQAQREAAYPVITDVKQDVADQLKYTLYRKTAEQMERTALKETMAEYLARFLVAVEQKIAIAKAKVPQQQAVITVPQRLVEQYPGYIEQLCNLPDAGYMVLQTLDGTMIFRGVVLAVTVPAKPAPVVHTALIQEFADLKPATPMWSIVSNITGAVSMWGKRLKARFTKPDYTDPDAIY